MFEEGAQDQFADDKDDIIMIEPEQSPEAIVSTAVVEDSHCRLSVALISITFQEEPTKIDDAEQGQLVHQILKTQKELNDSVVDVAQNRHLEIVSACIYLKPLPLPL